MTWPLIAILSGPIASGKTTLAQEMAEGGWLHLRTRELLEKEAASAGTMGRHALQGFGAALDMQTQGRWILEYLEAACQQGGSVVVDSVRTIEQVEAIRGAKAFRDAAILHIHLGARADTLECRYMSRGDAEDYARAKRHPVEARVGDLSSVANLTVSTDWAPHLVSAQVSSFILGELDR